MLAAKEGTHLQTKTERHSPMREREREKLCLTRKETKMAAPGNGCSKKLLGAPGIATRSKKLRT